MLSTTARPGPPPKEEIKNQPAKQQQQPQLSILQRLQQPHPLPQILRPPKRVNPTEPDVPTAALNGLLWEDQQQQQKRRRINLPEPWYPRRVAAQASAAQNQKVEKSEQEHQKPAEEEKDISRALLGFPWLPPARPSLVVKNRRQENNEKKEEKMDLNDQPQPMEISFSLQRAPSSTAKNKNNAPATNNKKKDKKDKRVVFNDHPRVKEVSLVGTKKVPKPEKKDPIPSPRCGDYLEDRVGLTRLNHPGLGPAVKYTCAGLCHAEAAWQRLHLPARPNFQQYPRWLCDNCYQRASDDYGSKYFPLKPWKLSASPPNRQLVRL